MWFALAVRTLLTAIQEATKNKKKRAQYRSKMIAVRDALIELYPLED